MRAHEKTRHETTSMLVSFDRGVHHPQFLKFEILVACALFALAYTVIPWPEIFESIYRYSMIDRKVYEMQIVTHDLSIDYLGYNDKISYITREYFWQATLRYFSREIGLSPAIIFGIISFIAIFSFSLTIARTVGLPWIVLLVNPLVVDFAFSQLRLALAAGLALIFINLYLSRPIRTSAVAVALSMIHTASMLFFFMGGVAKWVSAQTWARTYVAAIPLVLSGMTVSVLIGPVRGFLLGFAGDRRAVYSDMGSSGLYLAFWIGLLLVLIYRWKAVRNRFETAIAIIILSLVATNLLTNGYSTRFLAAAFPFLIISMISLDGIYRLAVLYAFVFYALYQWVFWLRLLG